MTVADGSLISRLRKMHLATGFTIFASCLLSASSGIAQQASPQAGVIATQETNADVDYAHTTARVTFETGETWVDGIGPLEYRTIIIEGEINRDTLKILEADFAKIQPLAIRLNSEGGSVEAAIEVGRFLRGQKAYVYVPKNDICASSCIFILAGGATRYVAGTLGIHRPYLETPSVQMTESDVGKAANDTYRLVKGYLAEMNISGRLADDMMAIPSTNVRWLTRDEIDLYGLGADDPVIAETKAIKEAQKYGLSREEYEIRRQRARNLCTLGAVADCWDRVMQGDPTIQ